MKTKIKELSGIEIFVDEDGWFTATIDQREFKDRALTGLEKKIGAVTNETIEAIQISMYSNFRNPPDQVKVTYDKRASRFRDTTTGKLLPQYDTYLKFDPAIYKSLMELNEEYRKLVVRYNDIIGSADKIRK